MEVRIENIYNQAVDAALNQDWKSAIELNNKVLEMDPDHTDAHVSLGFAYMQQDDLTKAHKHFKKALKQDPTNAIAQNNIEKIDILKKKGSDKSSKSQDKKIKVTPDTFMNIKGKTRVVTLSNIGQADILAELKVGERANLEVRKRRVEVRSEDGDYIGCLPDDISKRLIFFLNASSKYETIIKSATKNSVDVFIKELRKGKRVENFVSFPDNIQEDMKLIIGKADEVEENIQSVTVEDDDEDEEADVENLEELAKKAEEEAEKDEEILGIDTDTD